VIEHQGPTTVRGVRGSLILRTADNSTEKFYYDSSSLDCGTVEDLPGKGLKVTSLELSSASFTLYNRPRGGGRSRRVSTQQHEELSAGDIGFTRVRSLRREGCTSQAKLALIVISAVAATLLIAITAGLLFRRRMSQQYSATSTSLL